MIWAGFSFVLGFLLFVHCMLQLGRMIVSTEFWRERRRFREMRRMRRAARRG